MQTYTDPLEEIARLLKEIGKELEELELRMAEREAQNEPIHNNS